MVIGIGTGLVALGLALPTGLAFGYGYGYGVRQGYSAFRPPGKTAMSLKQSPDPIAGSLGMGLQVAEERTNTLNLGRPSLQSQESAISDTSLKNLSPSESNRVQRAEQKRQRLINVKGEAPKFSMKRNIRFGSRKIRGKF